MSWTASLTACTTWDRSDSPEVTADDIAEVVSMWTGVPVMQMATENQNACWRWKNELKKAIIGQDEAIEAIAKAVRRACRSQRPAPPDWFLHLPFWPTGVGKTEQLKRLRASCSAAKRLIQLICPSLGTVWSAAGWRASWLSVMQRQATEAIRRRPYSIVVLMKSRPILKRTTCVADHGRGHLRRKGHKIDFRNAIIIMTSNVGDLIKRQTAWLPLTRDERLRGRGLWKCGRSCLTAQAKYSGLSSSTA